MTRWLAFTLLLLFAAPALASPLAEGRFEVRGSVGGLLVAAPHGGFDRFSEDVARQVAWAADGGYLIALGYRTPAHPWNVNRPTAGVGLASANETEPPEAAAVYAAYAAHVRRLAPRLYVEIHGNGRKESAGWAEVATQGVGPDDARFVKAEFERRAAALSPTLGMRIEPIDKIHYAASGVKRRGVFRLVGKALHFELPWAMRGDERVRSRYAWAIAQTVAAYDARLRAAP